MPSLQINLVITAPTETCAWIMETLATTLRTKYRTGAWGVTDKTGTEVGSIVIAMFLPLIDMMQNMDTGGGKGDKE